MAELFADREPGFAVGLALRGREASRPRPTGRRRRPSGQLAVAGLRVLVAEAVNAVHAGRGAFVLDAPHVDKTSTCQVLLRYAKSLTVDAGVH